MPEQLRPTAPKHTGRPDGTASRRRPLLTGPSQREPSPRPDHRWAEALVRPGGGPEQLGEDGLQSRRPGVIALLFQMQPIARDPGQQVALVIRQLVVDVDKADRRPVGKRREPHVDRPDGRGERGVLGAGEEGGHHDRRSGRFLAERGDDRLDSVDDIRDGRLIGRAAPGQVVRACLQDDDLRGDAVELAVPQAPEDVVRRVAPPAEVRRIPAVEVPRPVGQESGVVGRPPSSRDRVALEIDVDLPPLRLRDQLPVGRPGVRIAALDGGVGGSAGLAASHARRRRPASARRRRSKSSG